MSPNVWASARRRPAPQSEAGLRPHDRLGPRWPPQEHSAGPARPPIDRLRRLEARRSGTPPVWGIASIRRSCPARLVNWGCTGGRPWSHGSGDCPDAWPRRLASLTASSRTTEDHKEAGRAFAEKRMPSLIGALDGTDVAGRPGSPAFGGPAGSSDQSIPAEPFIQP